MVLVESWTALGGDGTGNGDSNGEHFLSSLGGMWRRTDKGHIEAGKDCLSFHHLLASHLPVHLLPSAYLWISRVYLSPC